MQNKYLLWTAICLMVGCFCIYQVFLIENYIIKTHIYLDKITKKEVIIKYRGKQYLFNNNYAYIDKKCRPPEWFHAETRD